MPRAKRPGSRPRSRFSDELRRHQLESLLAVDEARRPDPRRPHHWKYVRSDDKSGPKEEVYRLRRDPDELRGDVAKVSRTRVERLRARTRELRP